MPPPAAASHATLVARHLHHERGGTPCSTTCPSPSGPPPAWASSARTGSASRRSCRSWPASLVPTAGEVRVDPPAATVGYLSQEQARDRDGDETVGASLARRIGVAGVEAELAAAASGLGRRRTGRRGTLRRRPRALRGGLGRGLRGPARQQPAHGWRSQPDIAAQPVATLSGGQEAKVALAAMLLARFDLTLLDEPTNDLDFDGLSRLEDVVARRTGGMVIVSHDRAFLERTVTDVLELDEHSRRGSVYGGGWAAYQSERAADQAHAVEDYAVYESQRGRPAPAGPARAPVGHQRRGPGEEAPPRQRQVAARLPHRTDGEPGRAGPSDRARALDALEAVEKPWEGWDLRFTISETARSGDVVVRLEDAVIERGDFTLGPFTLDIAWAERVALVGPNGSGKTTLVEAVLGRLPLAAGTRRLGPSVVVGELAQDRRILGDVPNLADAFTAATGLPQRPGPLAAGQVRARRRRGPPPRRRPSRRASAPGPSWPPSPRWASTSWSSTSRPTISICRPSNSSSRRCRTTAGRSCWSPTTGACSRRSPPPAGWSSPAGTRRSRGLRKG